MDDGANSEHGHGAIVSTRLVLNPLRVSDAGPMVAVLADPALYHFIGGEPPNFDTLHARYVMQVEGSLDEDEQWLNWIIRLQNTGEPIGFLQATIDVGLSVPETELAWLINPGFQRQGYATEAAHALVGWLAKDQSAVLTAKIRPDHLASQRMAASIGLNRTHRLDENGEELWTNRPT